MCVVYTRGGVYSCHALPWSHDHRRSHPYNPGTEHVGLPPTRQTLLAPSAKRRDGGGVSSALLNGSHRFVQLQLQLQLQRQLQLQLQLQRQLQLQLQR